MAKERNALRVTAACARARALGLLPGLSLTDARARVPHVLVQDADPAADALLLGRLAAMADRWSPMVALDPPHGLLIDISGCAHLFGGEAALAADVLARFGRHRLVRHALASTASAARALVHFSRQDAPDRFPMDATQEAEAILQLPLAALRLPPDKEAALRRAGLKRIADLADRPTAPLAARFGASAVYALDCLLGRTDSRIVALRPVPALLFARRFAEPIGHADAVLGALGWLGKQAARAMELQGMGGRHFAARLYRSDGAVRDLAIETGRPTRDPALLGRLFRERIDALADPLDPGFGFDLIRLAVVQTEPLVPAQPDLDQQQKDGEELAALVERLSIRHGRDRIRRLVPVNSHVPERAVQALAALDCGAAAWPVPVAGEPPLRPLCLFDPPQLIEALAEVPDAPPRRFRWRGATHIVARAEGPERIAAPWWKKSGEGRPTRDYYRVEDSEGRRFWLFRHGLHDRETVHPRWYVHGLFA